MLMRITRVASTAALGVGAGQSLLVGVSDTNTFVLGTNGRISTARFVNTAGAQQNGVDVSSTAAWRVEIGYYNLNGSFHATLSN